MRHMKQAIEVKLNRPVLILLSKNGVFKFARRGTKKHKKLISNDFFLPCASVNTLAEAELIQVEVCKLSYDGKLYRFSGFDGTFTGLDRAGERIECLYQHHKSGASGWPEGWEDWDVK